MERKVFASLVVLAFLYTIFPLLFPVAMGGMVAIVFSPWLERLERRKVSARLGSALLTLGITVGVILPTSVLVFIAAKNGFAQIQIWKRSAVHGKTLLEAFLNIPLIHNVLEWITLSSPADTGELADDLQFIAGSVWTKLAELLGGVLTQLPGLMVSLAITVVSVYFFLVDGRRLVLFFRRNSVFTPHQTDRLMSSLEGMSRSVILASLVSGGVQALLEVFTCVLTGTAPIFLIGFLVFIASFIPIVGALPVTLAVAIQQLLEGQQAAGIVLLIMSFVIVAVDNTVRPWFLRGSTNLHPLLAFVAAFGGLQTIGYAGVFLGPILAALFIVTVQILAHPDEHN